MRFALPYLFPVSVLLLSSSAWAQEEPDEPETPSDDEAPPSDESEVDEEEEVVDEEEAANPESDDATEGDEEPLQDEKEECPEGEECVVGEAKPHQPKPPEKKVDLEEEEGSSAEDVGPDASPPEVVAPTAESEPQTGADEAKTEEAAAAALSEAPPQGDSLWPLSLTTSTWSRFEVRQNYDKIGASQGRTQEGDLVVFRARMGLRTNPLPVTDRSDVFVQFTPQATGHWGQMGLGAQDSTVGELNLGIYEGYATLRTPRLDIQLGRMMMNYGNAVVIGDLDWNEKGRAFDGIRLHYKMDKGYLDLFGTQTGEAYPGGTSHFQGGDIYFWGAYTGIGGYAGTGKEDVDLDLYFLGLTAMTGDELDDGNGGLLYQKGGTLFTIGSRATGSIGPLEISAEAGVQLGHQAVVTSDPDLAETLEAQSAFAYMGELEFGLPLGSETRVSAGGIIASGDLPDTEGAGGWNQLFPTAHKFLGLMDIIGPRTNILDGHLQVDRGLIRGMTLKIAGHIFSRLVDSADGEGSGLAGFEVDTQLIQRLGKYVYARGLYGLFIPATGHYASDDLISYGEVQAGVEY